MTISTPTQYSAILKGDFAGFTHRAFVELNPATSFLHNWHIDLLAEKLEDVRLGRTRRLIINVPPRGLKSHLASIAFPAWLLGHNPSAKILCISYGQDFANKLARDCRHLMQSPFYQSLFPTRLSPARQAAEEFETTAGGYRISMSITGGIMGRGADFIIIDDPLKADDALSDPLRNSVNQSFSSSILSRQDNKKTAAIIIIMQRLHTDDLSAYVRERDDWDVISLPALAEKDEAYNIRTPYGDLNVVRKMGDALHPEREPIAVLQGLKKQMREYNFTAQYQQNPQPAAGLLIKKEWLRFYDSPHGIPDGGTVLQSWDTANKDGNENDFSVCTTWRVVKGDFYLIDVCRDRFEFPALRLTAIDLAHRFCANVVLVEDGGSGTQLIQELKMSGITVKAASVQNVGKSTRLSNQTAKFEGGHVRLPNAAPWLDCFIQELTSFPVSRFDDQVDSTVHALAWYTHEMNAPDMGFILYLEKAEEDAKLNIFPGDVPEETLRVRCIKNKPSHVQTPTGQRMVPDDGVLVLPKTDALALVRGGNWEFLR